MKHEDKKAVQCTSHVWKLETYKLVGMLLPSTPSCGLDTNNATIMSNSNADNRTYAWSSLYCRAYKEITRMLPEITELLQADYMDIIDYRLQNGPKRGARERSQWILHRDYL
jgi:hypothetical protein